MNPLRPLRGLVEIVSAVPQVVRAVLILPKLSEQLDEVVRNTALMREDTQTIAVHVPHLVILEQSLPAMVPLLEDMDAGVRRLTEVAEPLESAAVRLGRLSARFPQRNGR